VLSGGHLLQLYIYKDSGRPDFGFGRIDHLESISQGLNRLYLHRHPDAGARGKHKVLVIDHVKNFPN
jgi:hypothetical protein